MGAVGNGKLGTWCRTIAISIEREMCDHRGSSMALHHRLHSAGIRLDLARYVPSTLGNTHALHCCSERDPRVQRARGLTGRQEEADEADYGASGNWGDGLER